jgi:hypothetical protein
MTTLMRVAGWRSCSPIRSVGSMAMAAGLAFLAACSGDELAALGEGRRAAEQTPASGERGPYTLFEAGAVRPVAVMESGIVAVTNIPDDRIELFRPRGRGVTHCGSVRVGLRPVAVEAVDSRLWVVNHLSDSVSIVDVDEQRCSARVERTLLVGDEPRDVVSARGRRGKEYVFVTAAHRGQNVRLADGGERDPQLNTPGLGRADVFVYDASDLGSPGEERPVRILTLFTDSPRALAVGDGVVYAAGFLSGNQTTLVRYQNVIDRGRRSYALLDANHDFQFDAGLPEAARVIEGGYPAIRGHGRCISTGRTAPQPQPRRNDFVMNVCVRTDPAQPDRALEIVPQSAGAVTPSCSCANALGQLQRTPPMIVRFHASPAECGANFSAALGGCWLEPPLDDSAGATLTAQAWNAQVGLTLPDRDVFAIDLGQTPPALSGAEFRHVGTTLFNMAVHPRSGRIFVSNTEARNHVRFEGPGADVAQEDRFANTTVRGHIAESRISVLDPVSRAVKPVHLNGHIDFSQCCAAGPNQDTERSLAFPTGMAISHKRDRRGSLLEDQDLYVAALGSDKVAVLSTAQIESAPAGGMVQDAGDHIEVPGGPAGLVLDERRDLLYVLARFSNELVVIDTDRREPIQRHAMYSPEPDRVIEGRRFLYDARRTSSHGDSACASCHIFGDFDGLAWDLGSPDDGDFMNFGPFFSRPEITSAPLSSHFLSVKGPMTTQSLRGMANHASMHWRGDRRGGLTSTVHEQPDTGAFDEVAAFVAFNVAFPGLNGRSEQLPDEEMQRFTDFILQLTYPPNPIRALDDSLTPGQKRARSRFFGCEITDESMALGECADGRNLAEETLGCNCLNPPEFMLGIVPRPAFCPPDPQCTLDVSDFQNTCNGCHALDPSANAEFGVDAPGFFGSNGLYTNDAVAHILKIPHLRNMYQKVGMFGSVLTRPGIGLNAFADSIFGARVGGLPAAQNAHMGDQIRGFGFTHAGEEDTLFHFFSLSGFARAPAPGFPLINPNRAGFEPSMPSDTQTCFGDQLPSLNDRFLAELAAPDVVEELRRQRRVISDPASTPDEVAEATAALTAFLNGLPASNPGAVFRRLPIQNAIAQLALPLDTCRSLPGHAELEALGCFQLAVGPSCASLIGAVRSCAQWGSTLEQVVSNGTRACQAHGLADKDEMESFMFAFDSNHKPIVGQQVTLRRNPSAAARDRLALLRSQADAGHCDLVAHSDEHGYVYDEGMFTRDDGRRVSVDSLLRSRSTVTYTAVPVGQGHRSGVDRDGDGILDGDERGHGDR